jgi:hypothetical protein
VTSYYDAYWWPRGSVRQPPQQTEVHREAGSFINRHILSVRHGSFALQLGFFEEAVTAGCWKRKLSSFI